MKRKDRVAKLEGGSSNCGITILARAPANWTSWQTSEALAAFLSEEGISKSHTADIQASSNIDEFEVYWWGDLDAAILASTESTHRIGCRMPL